MGANHQIFVGTERLLCPRLGPIGVRSPGGVLFLQKCVGALYLFVTDKEESSLKISIPLPIKARAPFPREPKEGWVPLVDLEVAKQNIFANTSSEREAPTPDEELSPNEGRGRTHNPKGNFI